MNSKEELLAYIEQIEAERETVKTYGDRWKIRDWMTRRSMTAGKLCLVMWAITQAEAKAKRRPGSIGARKAKQKAKAHRRQLRSLETLLTEKYSDYKVISPQYINTWTPHYDLSPNRRNIVHKGCVNTSYYVD